MLRRGRLKRSGRLRQVSAKKAAALKAAGKPLTWRKPGTYTGPTPEVRAIVAARSGGWCEFPQCPDRAADLHHRYERGNGGTGPKSAAAPWINQAANLLASCRHHNDWCSNQQPEEARLMGWLLKDATLPAATVSVWTRHSLLPVMLDDAGAWSTELRGVAA